MSRLDARAVKQIEEAINEMAKAVEEIDRLRTQRRLLVALCSEMVEAHKAGSPVSGWQALEAAIENIRAEEPR